jgi:shikimate kinase
MGIEKRPAAVTLVGPKHTGKSSAGKALAKLIGARFIDLDELIEKQAGRPPRKLYEEGPEVFRDAERLAAETLVGGLSTQENGAGGPGSAPLIIAAGGGLIDNPPALAALRGAGSLVSLRISAEAAWARVCASAERTGSLPPFLRGDDPEGTHRALHERRGTAYGVIADFEIDAEKMNPTDIAEEIAHMLSLRRVSTGRNHA